MVSDRLPETRLQSRHVGRQNTHKDIFISNGFGLSLGYLSRAREHLLNGARSEPPDGTAIGRTIWGLASFAE